MPVQVLCVFAATILLASPASGSGADLVEIQSLLDRLNWANHIVLSPEEAHAQRLRYAELLERAAQGKQLSDDEIDNLKRDLDERENRAIARLTREYRLRTYQAFRLDRAELKRRREAWQALHDRWIDAGRPAATRNRVIGWLVEASKNSTPGRIAPLPELPDLEKPRVAATPDRKPAARSTVAERSRPKTDSAAADEARRTTPAPTTQPRHEPELPGPRDMVSGPNKRPATSPEVLQTPSADMAQQLGRSLHSLPAVTGRVLQSLGVPLPSMPAVSPPTRSPTSPSAIAQDRARTPAAPPRLPTTLDEPGKTNTPEPRIAAPRRSGPLPTIIRGPGVATAVNSPHRRPGVATSQDTPRPRRLEGAPAELATQLPRPKRPTLDRPTPQAIERSLSAPVPAPTEVPRGANGLLSALGQLDGLVKKHQLVDGLLPEREAAPAATSSDLVGALNHLGGQLRKHGLPEKALANVPAPPAPSRNLTGALKHLDGVVEQMLPQLASLSASAEPLVEADPPDPAQSRPRADAAKLPAGPPPTEANRPRINLHELEARIAGNNLSLRRLESRIDRLQPGDVADLAQIVDEFRKLADRRDDLLLYWNLLTPSQRATVETLQPADPLISLLGAHVFKARRFVAGDEFSGHPAQRQAALDRLDLMSQVLAETAAGR